MSEKKRENCTVVSQECIAAGIYSLWIQTEKIAADAKPGQFVSMYTKDKTKLLPRPISICEIDKEQGRLHLVYRVTGENTVQRNFHVCAWRYPACDRTSGKWLSGRKSRRQRVFLMGGCIGVPPILDLARI